MDVAAKLAEAREVGVTLSADGEIGDRLRGQREQRGQQLDTHEFAKSAFEPVALHGGVLMLRHDHSDARMAKRGSKYPDVEIPRPDSPPLSNDGQYVAAPREPKRARITEAVVRRLRISWEV